MFWSDPKGIFLRCLNYLLHNVQINIHVIFMAAPTQLNSQLMRVFIPLKISVYVPFSMQASKGLTFNSALKAYVNMKDSVVLAFKLFLWL